VSAKNLGTGYTFWNVAAWFEFVTPVAHWRLQQKK